MSCVCRGGSPSWIPQDQSSDCGVLSPSSLYELFLWGQFGVCWLDLLAIDLASRLWLCWWLGFKLREKLSLWRLRWCAYTFFKKKKHKKYHTHKKALYREPLCCTRFAKEHTHTQTQTLFREALCSVQGTIFYSRNFFPSYFKPRWSESHVRNLAGLDVSYCNAQNIFCKEIYVCEVMF